MMLDHKQAGRGYFEHEAQNRNGAGRAPDAKLVLVAPDTQMNSRSLDGGRYPSKRTRSKRQGTLQNKRMQSLLPAEERERDLRRVAFLPPKACPEGGLNDGFDCLGKGANFFLIFFNPFAGWG